MIKEKDIIKRTLWQFGYKVKDTHDVTPNYQLLVEGKWKVKVIAGIPENTIAKSCDVIAFVSKQGVKIYALPTRETPNGAVFDKLITSPIAVFGTPSAKVKGR